MLFLEILGASPLAALSEAQASVVMRIYAVGFASVFVLFLLMYAHAHKLRRELDLSAAEVRETRNAIQENLILAFIGATSFTIAFYRSDWAGWMYALIGPALWAHGAVFGKKVRLLAEET